MYRDQPLLADVLTLLSKLGFHFAGFTYHQEVAQYRAPIGMRGRGFAAFGDGLFLRRLETLPEMATSDSHLYLMAQKLAFIAVNFGHIEYALKALKMGNTLVPESGSLGQLQARSYYRFLKEFLATTERMEQRFPPLFGQDQVPYAGSGAAFVASSGLLLRLHRILRVKPEHYQKRIRHLIFSHPLVGSLKILEHFSGQVVRLRHRLKPRLLARLRHIPMKTPRQSHATPLERLLQKHAFHDVADLVRRRRLEGQTQW